MFWMTGSFLIVLWPESAIKRAFFWQLCTPLNVREALACELHTKIYRWNSLSLCFCKEMEETLSFDLTQDENYAKQKSAWWSDARVSNLGTLNESDMLLWWTYMLYWMVGKMTISFSSYWITFNIWPISALSYSELLWFYFSITMILLYMAWTKISISGFLFF